MQSGAIAGAVALATVGDTETLTTTGVQNLETGVSIRADTIFRIMSMTKPITAALAMILVGDGRLALEDEVGRFLPDADDVAIATELGQIVFPAANKGDDRP